MIALVAAAITPGAAAEAQPDSATMPRSIVVLHEKPQFAAPKIKQRGSPTRITARITKAAVMPRATAAEIERLIRSHANYTEPNNTEIVRFADPREHPVTVVRGGRPTFPRAPDDRIDQIGSFAGKRQQTVRILSGGPTVERISVATISVERTQAPTGRPIRAAAQVVTFANRFEQPVTVLRGAPATPIDPDQPLAAGTPDLDLFGAARGADLDRVAFAVDGAESSHGADPAMWRPELDGPEGPMQVSAAAAIDSGGGDRFDLTENRQLGRAYLARLFRRYGNWPDAIAAYNWGPGNMDLWIAQGRPVAGLPLGVERYRERVLRDGAIRQGPGSPLSPTGWQLQTP